MIEDFDNVSYYWPSVYKEHKNYASQEWFVFVVIFKKNSRLKAYQKTLLTYQSRFSANAWKIKWIIILYEEDIELLKKDPKINSKWKMKQKKYQSKIFQMVQILSEKIKLCYLFKSTGTNSIEKIEHVRFRLWKIVKPT